MKVTRWILGVLAHLSAASLSLAQTAGDQCDGNFPNLISDVCWSCSFPMKLFGSADISAAVGGSGEDYDSGGTKGIACTCLDAGQAKIGMPTSFWEFNQMTEIVTTPGCFPMLEGAQVDVGVNKHAYGQVSDDTSGAGDQNTARDSFRQINLYINPAMYVMGAVLDDSCLDNRGIDIPWVSFADPTHNDEELANILTPYAFPFGSLVAIGAMSADAIAATAGFPLASIFWAAGSWGPMYPLTGTNQNHLSGDQAGRLQTARVLAKLHAAGTQFSTAGKDAMCDSGYPQVIMDKRQYKITRLFPKPQTAKINGKCCDPIGRSTILGQSSTEAPTSEAKDYGYAIFRKRDCCTGVYP